MTELIDLTIARLFRADELVMRAVAASTGGDRELARQLLDEARDRLHGIPQGKRRDGLLRTLRTIKRDLT